MRTDVGCVRRLNEDAVAFVTPAADAPDGRFGALAIVADGMGGHAAGEVASSLAVEIVWRIFYSMDAPPSQVLRTALEAANKAILDYAAAHPECAGMGTTCTVIGVRDRRLWLGHIGDSRAYILREGRLTQLSDDQTLHAQMVRDGLMSREEAGTGPGSNVILQALGTREEIEPTVWEEGLPLRAGDAAVLCSDGLYNLVEDEKIRSAVANHAPAEACLRLIEAARAGGGYDNISVGVFVVEDDVAASHVQSATQRIYVGGAVQAAATATIRIEAEG
ncbi:protein phosphatase 2C domain-containing protein [Methylocystis sp. S23]